MPCDTRLSVGQMVVMLLRRSQSGMYGGVCKAESGSKGLISGGNNDEMTRSEFQGNPSLKTCHAQ